MEPFCSLVAGAFAGRRVPNGPIPHTHSPQRLAAKRLYGSEAALAEAALVMEIGHRGEEEGRGLAQDYWAIESRFE